MVYKFKLLIPLKKRLPFCILRFLFQQTHNNQEYDLTDQSRINGRHTPGKMSNDSIGNFPADGDEHTR